MAQITLDIDDAVPSRLPEAARHASVWQGRFVADLVRRATSDRRSDEVLALAGSTPDAPDAEALRVGAAFRRRA
jgi:hypothetical protein